MIKKVKGSSKPYKLVSKTTGKVLGSHSSKKKAQAQERAIQAAKSARKGR